MQWTIWDTLMVEMFFALLVLHAVPMDNIPDQEGGSAQVPHHNETRITSGKCWNMINELLAIHCHPWPSIAVAIHYFTLLPRRKCHGRSSSGS